MACAGKFLILQKALQRNSDMAPPTLWELQAGCIVFFFFLGTLCCIPKGASSHHYRRILINYDKGTYCDDHFGEGWLAHWNSTAKSFCQAQAYAAASQLTCR